MQPDRIEDFYESECVGFDFHHGRGQTWYVMFVYGDESSAICLVSGTKWVAERLIEPGQPIRAAWLPDDVAARFEETRSDVINHQSERRNQ